MSSPLFTAALPHYTPAAGKAVPYDWFTTLMDNTSAVANGYGTQTDVSTTGTTNNLAPAAAAWHQVWTGASTWTITGQVPVQNGQIQVYSNQSASSVLKFTHEDAGSTAANRFTLPSTQGQQIGPKGSIGFRYDGTNSRWRVLFIEPGAPIAFTPTITSSGGGTPTYTTQVGTFVQRGSVAHVQGRITLATKGTLAAGTAGIGLPFTSTPTTSNFGHMTIGYFSGMTTAIVMLAAYIQPSTAGSTFCFTTGAAAGTTTCNVTDISGTFDVIFSADYALT